MRAFYGVHGEDPSVLYAMGLPPEEIKRRVADGAAPVVAWPENAAAFRVFRSMETQWRTGFHGATGLDYTALPAVMRFSGIVASEEQTVFEGVRAMELEALSIFAERRRRG